MCITSLSDKSALLLSKALAIVWPFVPSVHRDLDTICRRILGARESKGWQHIHANAFDGEPSSKLCELLESQVLRK